MTKKKDADDPKGKEYADLSDGEKADRVREALLALCEIHGHTVNTEKVQELLK